MLLDILSQTIIELQQNPLPTEEIRALLFERTAHALVADRLPEALFMAAIAKQTGEHPLTPVEKGFWNGLFASYQDAKPYLPLQLTS